LSKQDSPLAWSLGPITPYTARPTPQVFDQYLAAQPLTLGQ
jgi:xylulokinase